MSALPDGGEWATAPLLDPANVGRYVWYVFNSNAKWATPLPIVKIGRTNVHVGTRGARPSSLRVEVDTGGHTAYGTTGGGYGETVYTEQRRLDNEERGRLWPHLRDYELALRRRPLPVMERAIELIRPGAGLTERPHLDREEITEILADLAVTAEANAAAGYGRLSATELAEYADRICDLFYE